MRLTAKHLLLVSCFAITTPILSLGQAVTAVRIDGTFIEGRWLGGSERAVRIETSGQPVEIGQGDLESLEFENAGESSPPIGSIFHLADGGRFVGELSPAEADAVVAKTRLAERTVLPFESLAAVQFAPGDAYPKAAQIFWSALASRLPGKDALITRDLDDVKTVQGRLESLGPAEGSFFFGDRARAFQVEKMFGVVLAAGPTGHPAHSVTVSLQDGTVFSGRLAESDAASINVAASFGQSVRIGASDVARLDFRSDRVVHLSDLAPAAEKSEGILHDRWPVRRDQNVAAGPLAINGRTFRRGLGMHSRGEVTYDLPEKFASFVATVGIDDTVRPRGSVIFRVLGDGKVLHDSGLVTGRDPAKNVSVDLAGVSKLTLIVDYGDQADLSDYANWGDARLLRPSRN